MSYVLSSAEVRQKCLREISNLSVSVPAKYEVCIKKHKKSKTASQRRYLHKILSIVSDQTGHHMEDLKMGIKYKVLPLREVKVDGRTHLFPISSEKTTVQQYADLIESALMLAEKLDVAIPPPQFWGYSL